MRIYTTCQDTVTDSASINLASELSMAAITKLKNVPMWSLQQWHDIFFKFQASRLSDQKERHVDKTPLTLEHTTPPAENT
jgi:hypothetical protein